VQVRLGESTHEDDLEEHLLVDLHELLIPLVDIGGLLPAVVLIVGRLGGVVPVVLAPLDDLAQHGVVHVGDRDGAVSDRVIAEIVDQVLDEHGPLGDHAICDGVSVVSAGEVRGELD
jgi:hypothetical protein